MRRLTRIVPGATKQFNQQLELTSQIKITKQRTVLWYTDHHRCYHIPACVWRNLPRLIRNPQLPASLPRLHHAIPDSLSRYVLLSNSRCCHSSNQVPPVPPDVYGSKPPRKVPVHGEVQKDEFEWMQDSQLKEVRNDGFRHPSLPSPGIYSPFNWKLWQQAKLYNMQFRAFCQLLKSSLK